VHDWFEKYAGAERVVEQLVACYPDSELYSLVDFLEPNQRDFLRNKQVHTSFIQRLPFARKKFRNYLPLMPIAIEQFDLTPFDIIWSSNWAVAKGVITGPEQLHISYIHTPVRYAWEMQPIYWRPGLKGAFIRIVLHKFRMWDYAAASRVNVMVANSRFVARRIAKCYGRKSKVIYPPVNIDEFELQADKDDFYLMSSRLVPYKRFDLAVAAFAKMPHRKLVVLGDGGELERLKKMAGPNVEFAGWKSRVEQRKYMQRARALIFPAIEDFGITPVEAQACGTPVIAFGKGGALETIVGEKTGEFFQEQTVESLIEAIERFEAKRATYDPYLMRENAERFKPERFRAEVSELTERSWAQFQKQGTCEEEEANDCELAVYS
jgi:glycosyltransferase involved in cell wall biosynthesis